MGKVIEISFALLRFLSLLVFASPFSQESSTMIRIVSTSFSVYCFLFLYVGVVQDECSLVSHDSRIFHDFTMQWLSVDVS